MIRESDLSIVTSLINSDKIRLVTEADLSRQVSFENLKAEIAAGDKLINDYYYFQDASNPQMNDWRIYSNMVYLDFERYSGTEWIRQFRMGGSAFVERLIAIERDANSDLLSICEVEGVKNLVRCATWSPGVAVGEVTGHTFISTSGTVFKVSPIEDLQWKTIQPVDTSVHTGSEFSVSITTSSGIDGFIATKARVKGTIGVGTKGQLLAYRQSEPDRAVWKNVSDVELDTGGGADIDPITGEIDLVPRFYGIGNLPITLKLRTNQDITLDGGNTEGTDTYFEVFDQNVDFSEMLDWETTADDIVSANLTTTGDLQFTNRDGGTQILDTYVPMLSEFIILDSANNYEGIYYIKHTDQLASSFSSTFNTNAKGVASGSLIFDRHNAPLVTKSFDTLTINPSTISTGTFSLSQAQADQLGQGNGAIEITMRLADLENNTILQRDAGMILFQLAEEEIENTILVNGNGSDDFDGKTPTYPKATISAGLDALEPLSGHKKLVVQGVGSWGDFLNSNSVGNVSNLIVDAFGDTFDNVTLQDHATTFNCRHINENIIIGDQCEVNCQTIGSATAHTITFVAEAHDNTKIKAKRVESTTTLSFAGIASGSKVIIEIDHYEGNVVTALGTIPANVEVIGWIGEYDLSASAYGNDFQYFTSLTESSTTSSTFQSKVSATSSILPKGTYKISFNCEASNGSSESSTDVRFSVNGSPIHNHTSGDDWLSTPSVDDGSNEWITLHSIHYITLATNATVNMDIDYKRASGTARISNAIIELYRVE